MNQAQAYVNDLQAQQPPWGNGDGRPFDRAVQIHANLKPRLPARLRRLASEGRLVVAEIGRRSPDAYCLPFADKSFAIVLNSGLMHFLYAVSRIMCMRAVVVGPGEEKTESSGNIDAMVERMRALFARFGDPAAELRDVDFPLAQAQIAFANRIAIHGEAFVLGHELGHADFLMQRQAAAAAKFDAEEHADRIAARLMTVSDPGNGRWPYAGAIFALRVFACLELLGHKFPETYPPIARRLQLVRQIVESIHPDETARESLQRIGTSLDQMLESIENKLASRDPVVETSERLSSRIAAVLEEIVSHRESRAGALAQVNKWLAWSPADILPATAVRLERLLRPKKLGGSKHADPRNYVELEALRSALSEPHRTVFSVATTQG